MIRYFRVIPLSLPHEHALLLTEDELLLGELPLLLLLVGLEPHRDRHEIGLPPRIPDGGADVRPGVHADVKFPTGEVEVRLEAEPLLGGRPLVVLRGQDVAEGQLETLLDPHGAVDLDEHGALLEVDRGHRAPVRVRTHPPVDGERRVPLGVELGHDEDRGRDGPAADGRLVRGRTRHRAGEKIAPPVVLDEGGDGGPARQVRGRRRRLGRRLRRHAVESGLLLIVMRTLHGQLGVVLLLL